MFTPNPVKRIVMSKPGDFRFKNADFRFKSSISPCKECVRLNLQSEIIHTERGGNVKSFVSAGKG